MTGTVQILESVTIHGALTGYKSDTFEQDLADPLSSLSTRLRDARARDKELEQALARKRYF